MTTTFIAPLAMALLGAVSAVAYLAADEVRVPRGLAARLPDVAAMYQAAAHMRSGRVSRRDQAALRVLAFLLAVTVGGVLLPFSRTWALLLATPFAAVGVAVPALFAGEVTVWRKRALERDLLPFFAHVMLRLQTATLLDALRSYCRAYDGVLAEEVQRVVDVFHTGRSLAETFTLLAQQYDSAYLRRFAQTVDDLLESEQPVEIMTYFFDDLLQRVRTDALRAVRRRAMAATVLGVLLMLPALLALVFEPAVVMFLRNFQ